VNSVAIKLLGRALGPLHLFLAVTVLGCLLLGPPAALAKVQSVEQPPSAGKLQAPDHFSAGDQYVETLPSAKGPKAATGRHGGSVDLPRKIKQTLVGHGGPGSAKLIQIATSPELGAPQQKHGKGEGTRAKKRNGPSQPAVPSAAIDAVGGGQAGLGWLVLALLVITALALGAVGYQRYKDRDASG
jgi:hypothetical protein